MYRTLLTAWIILMTVSGIGMGRIQMKSKTNVLTGAHEAVLAVLEESWRPKTTLAFVTDGTIPTFALHNVMEKSDLKYNFVTFVAPFSKLNKTVKSLSTDIFENLAKMKKFSSTTIVVASDDLRFLSYVIEETINNDLLIWPSRLLVVSRLNPNSLGSLREWLSAINVMVVVLKEYSSLKRCDVYICIPYSQRMAVIASWNHLSGLSYTSSYQLFPDKFRRFADGANLDVVGLHYPPHVIVRQINSEGAEGYEHHFSGPLITMLNMVATNANFTYKLILTPDGSWGYRFPNGTWNGMIGMMIRKKVNFGLGPFGVTYIRSRVIDYTNYLLMDYGRILGRRGNTEVDPWGFVMPLAPMVWAATFGTLLLVLFVAIMAYKVDWLMPELSPKVPLSTYVRAFLQQDILVPSESGWEKILLGAWMLAVFIVVECYSTNLISLLAVRYISEPYQSVRIMLDDPTVKMVWTANTAYAQHLADVDSGIFYEAKQKAKEGRIRYIRAPEYITSVDSLVSRGDHVLLNPLILMKMFLTEDYMENGNCKFYVSRETFLPQTFCLAVQKNSPLRGPINEGIRAVVEGGLYQYWLDNAIPNAKSCKDPPTKIIVKAPFSFNNLWGLFVVLVTGYVVSFLVLSLEILGAIVKRKDGKQT